MEMGSTRNSDNNDEDEDNDNVSTYGGISSSCPSHSSYTLGSSEASFSYHDHDHGRAIRYDILWVATASASVIVPILVLLFFWHASAGPHHRWN